MKAKPTQQQISEILEQFQAAQDSMRTIRHFLETHVENCEAYKVHSTIKRYENKLDGMRGEYFDILRKEFPE